MAAAVGLAVAEKLAEAVLPHVLERMQSGRAPAISSKTYEQAAQMQPTVRKCVAILAALTEDQSNNLQPEIGALQTALAKTEVQLQDMLRAAESYERPNQPMSSSVDADAGEPSGLLDKAKLKATELKTALKDTVRTGVDTVNAAADELLYGDKQRAQLAALNDELLHASLDLALALSRLKPLAPPPKSKTCVVL